MATCYRASGRAKSSNVKTVVPSWDSVWKSFKEERQKTSIELMNAEGWKTLRQVADELGMSRQHINAMALNGNFEMEKRKAFHAGKTRELVFIRPKIL